MLGTKKDKTEETPMSDTVEDNKKYGEPWDTAHISVASNERGGNKIVVDLNLPGDPDDKVIVETSVARAAKNMVDNIAGWLLKASQEKN